MLRLSLFCSTFNDGLVVLQPERQSAKNEIESNPEMPPRQRSAVGIFIVPVLPEKAARLNKFRLPAGKHWKENFRRKKIKMDCVTTGACLICRARGCANHDSGQRVQRQLHVCGNRTGA